MCIYTYMYIYISDSVLSKTAIFPKKEGRKREISNESAHTKTLFTLYFEPILCTQKSQFYVHKIRVHTTFLTWVKVPVYNRKTDFHICEQYFAIETFTYLKMS